MAEFKIPLIAVVGPTASSKTSLAVEICKHYGAEAVSCDSMQIYKGMDIASAKPSEDEMQGIPHHLIGFLSPNEQFSVAMYCEMAKKAINDIHSRGKKAVLVGGTGLYFSSLVNNIEFIPQETDFEYREHLKKEASLYGAQKLLDDLYKIDPESACNLHVNNLGRIIRALEIYHTTGKTKTLQDIESQKEPSPYDLTVICLDAKDRQILYNRINKRVDIMLEMGLVDEAKLFFQSEIGKTAAQAIGYKELEPYIKNEKSLEDCIENLKMQTRRYAKRQLTWFRRDSRMNFLYIDDYSSFDELYNAAIDIIERGVKYEK